MDGIASYGGAMATASGWVVLGAWALAMLLLLGWAAVGDVGWSLAAMVTAELCLLLALAPVATEFCQGRLPSSASDCARDILLDVAMVSAFPEHGPPPN
jgi:hypothetical protein